MTPKISKLKVYEYSGCSTCKKALKFLEARKIHFEKRAILEHPPTEAELEAMTAFLKGDIRKLFNTSGQVYREMRLGEKISGLSQREAIQLLSRNGKLIKRPFAIMEGAGLVGFKEDEWEKLFS